MKKIMTRYIGVLIASILFVAFLLVFPVWRTAAIAAAAFQAKTMLLVIPPIFILLGLLDVWVPRQQMIKYMGSGAGIKGPLIAFLLGSFAAGPLYGAFPFAATLMKKGASLMNILVFIGAWSTTKIPMILFEIAALGPRFALSRLAIDIVGIVIIAFAIKATLPKAEVERLYAVASTID
ncbi:MAG: permease [Spirochaetia bacterium]|nr:permease [Spirochaetia bacterium]